jgi:hypothetical protein
MKTLTNSGDFTGSRIRILNSGACGGTSANLDSALKNPTANHPPMILKSITVILFKNVLNFVPLSPAFAIIYRITCSLNAATSILNMVSVGIFKICQCFHRSKQKFEFPFSQ